MTLAPPPAVCVMLPVSLIELEPLIFTAPVPTAEVPANVTAVVVFTNALLLLVFKVRFDAATSSALPAFVPIVPVEAVFAVKLNEPAVMVFVPVSVMLPPFNNTVSVPKLVAPPMIMSPVVPV